MRPITLPAPTASWAPSFLVGSACIVAGGLVAAISAASPSEKGAWVAAYLVLVGGVTQIALGLGQAWLASRTPPARVVVIELASLNLGNAAVIGGTLTGQTWLVDTGGALLVTTLALCLWSTLHARGNWIAGAYRLLIVGVLVSIPIGLILARMGS